MHYSELPLAIQPHSTAWKYFTLHSGVHGIFTSVHMFAFLTFARSESLFAHLSDIVSASELAAPPVVQIVLQEEESQQEQYNNKFREHFKAFDICQLKTILKNLEYPFKLSYNCQKKDLIETLLLAAPADLCEKYPDPSHVSILQKVPRPKLSAVESSKSGPGLGYFSYLRELQRRNDENYDDFWYFVPAKKSKKDKQEARLSQEHICNTIESAAICNTTESATQLQIRHSNSTDRHADPSETVNMSMQFSSNSAENQSFEPSQQSAVFESHDDDVNIFHENVESSGTSVRAALVI